MLESAALLLDWAKARAGGEPPGTLLCHVRDGTTRTLLGAVRMAAGGSWFWRRPRDLLILEGDDEALLCSVKRFWFGTSFWLVEDAEGNRIGTIRVRRRGALQFDRANSSVARSFSDSEAGILADGDSSSKEARALTSRGSLLATFTSELAQTRIEFANDLDPFVRMLLLATALLWRR